MDIKQENHGENQTVINNESGVININQPGTSYTDMATKQAVHIYKNIPPDKQERFVTAFFAVILIPAISLIADLMQIHPALNFPLLAYVVVFILIMLVAIAGFMDNFKIMGIDINADESKHLYGDRFVCKDKEDYVIFTYIADCIYPNCAGKIKIVTRPQRYNGEYALFGKCSIGDKQHSYGIDNNLIAYPIKVDWRDLPPENK
ncbi:hypothetical protein [Aliivibrio fischeri]|uniref:hypothetical protein n=1 Tax=Aliivibrio fischeri TaxID=668 RepID=UPI003735B97E